MPIDYQRYASSMECIVWAGRYQPPHVGHKELFSLSLSTWEEPHVLGVVWGSKNSSVEWAQNNPKHFGVLSEFTAWERCSLWCLIADALGASKRTSVVTLPRFDMPGGEEYQQLLPENHVRATTDKDAQDLSNVEFWHSRGFKVRVLSSPPGLLTGTEMRRKIARGYDWKLFVPEECHSYFIGIDGPGRLARQAMAERRESR